MTIETRPGVVGFVASDPELTATVNGDARLYFLAGQEHVRFEEDGSRTKLDSTFFPMVMFGTSAELAEATFQKGDVFIAHGKVETYPQTIDGQQVERERFRASHIGHDNNVTDYTVDRSRRGRDSAGREAPEREGASREAADADPLGEILDQREAAVRPDPAATTAASRTPEAVAR